MKNLKAGYSRKNALQQMAAITMSAGLAGMIALAITRNVPKNIDPCNPFICHLQKKYCNLVRVVLTSVPGYAVHKPIISLAVWKLLWLPKKWGLHHIFIKSWMKHVKCWKVP